MSSDYEFSDAEYYDDDEEMMEADDGTADSEDEMDMEPFNDPVRVSGKGKKAYEVDYDDLSQQQVEQLMLKDINDIGELFGADLGSAALLLRHLAWNKDRLIEKYMDNGSTISTAAGVTPPLPTTSPGPERSQRRTTTRVTRSSKKTSPPPPAEPFVCPICFDETHLDVRSLACGHAFCTDCWRDYAHSKIREEGEHRIACMAEGCNVVAPDPFVYEALASDEARTVARYRELLVRDYVEGHKDLRFCPYPECTHTVRCGAGTSSSALAAFVPTVVCGANPKHEFCFGCNIESDHRPLICAVAKMWLQKCRDDSETANWIKSNTKECSKCQSTIEKNGGCNHMTCKKCKHEFCWVCMGSWQEHGTAWYSCNRFDEKSGVDARDAQSKSRASLERYLHYYNRWANHEQSAKLSVELYAKTEKKMQEMQENTDLTWIEVQFMKKAVDEVEKCRMTLKWTYAMAYYLGSGNAKELFEDNQRDLEKAVEDLSELLEQPIEPETIPAIRQKVTDKAVYVSKRNEILLEDTALGFQDGRWQWNINVPGIEAL